MTDFRHSASLMAAHLRIIKSRESRLGQGARGKA